MLLFTLIILTLGVAFVNGFTDAPNAIASSVASRSINIKTAVILAGIADFTGSLLIGLFNQNVTHTVMNIATFGENPKVALTALVSSMCAVIIWAVSAWKFGIPTSESHALISGLIGASIAINNSFLGINILLLNKVLVGLILSSVAGLFSGFLLSKITVFLFSNVNKEKSDKIFTKFQILSGILMSFMHGAQDSQKFSGILSLAISLSGYSVNKKMSLIMLIFSSFVIALGTSTGGERIIKSVSMDMLKIRKDQGFSADFAGVICLLISTLYGMPVSTTHTKTSAMMGVGFAKSLKSVDFKIAGEMIATWILTFPCCGFLSWLTVKLFISFI